MTCDMRVAEFDKHVRALLNTWRTERLYWESLHEGLNDEHIRDNVIHERNVSLSKQMNEMCKYLSAHWDIVEQSPTLKDAIYFKVLEMCDDLPDFFDTGMTFIEQMYAV
jgi:hypothetical protein